jgi:hypothetical protein
MRLANAGVLTLFVLTTFLIGPFLARRPRSDKIDGRWRGVRRIVLATVGLQFLLIGVASAGGFSKGSWVFALAVSVGIMDVGLGAERETRHRHLARLLVLACGPLLLVSMMWVGMAQATGGALPSELDHTLSRGPLTGVRVQSKAGQPLGDLLDHLESEAPPGSFLLVYYDAPMVYFASHTRPSPPFAWTTVLWPPEVQEEAVAYMRHRDREPRTVVRLRSAPRRGGVAAPTVDLQGPEPIGAYVRANYRLDRVFGEYEVWTRLPREECHLPAPN